MDTVKTGRCVRKPGQPSVRIATVLLPGGVLAQGPMLHGGKADLHGLVSVDAGGKVASGRLVQSVRR